MTGSRVTCDSSGAGGVTLEARNRPCSVRSSFVVIATGAGPKLTSHVGFIRAAPICAGRADRMRNHCAG